MKYLVSKYVFICEYMNKVMAEFISATALYLFDNWPVERKCQNAVVS